VNEPPELCADDTCPADAKAPQPAPADGPGSSAGLTIDVVSDVICPWCFIGKRRLEKALALLGHPAAVRVVWRPFRLNPQMPPQGVERRVYRRAKFGTWERSLVLDAQVAEAAAGEGLAFAFDKMTRTPNTLDAHRLIRLAQRIGVQDAVVEALFRAYFVEGLNLNDPPTLLALATLGGIPGPDAERLLSGDEGRAEVLAEEAGFKSLGVNGVPSFFVVGRFACSGAAPAPLLADAIRQALPRPGHG
jgi:predicted DsbA family dithiol-disulfide isomerase